MPSCGSEGLIMVTWKEKQILIDGKPVYLVSGEVHYFRMKEAQWIKVLDELNAAGANTVAAYIPWICHEQTEGDVDLCGKYREEHNLARFLELCMERKLYVIARPGPFIMAEMKNKGIP